MPEMPDWLRALALMGKHGADYVVVAVDALGQLYATVKGEDSGGTLHTLAVDDEGQLIMVPRGSGGNYMAVDSDGYLTTVIKGDYAGALKTLAVDADGKINAFIYDTQDAWGQISTVGLSEMSVRLGSPVSYERSGQVYFMETFETGRELWSLLAIGDDGACAITPEAYCTGGYSLRVVSGTQVGAWTRLTAEKGLLPVGRVGFALAVAFPSVFQYFAIKLRYFDGANYDYAAIRLNDASGWLEFYQSGVGYTNLAHLPLTTRAEYAWNHLKLVVDLSTGYYDRLRVNAQEYDLSAYALANWASADAPKVTVELQLDARLNQTNTCFCDDVLLTFAEP